MVSRVSAIPPLLLNASSVTPGSRFFEVAARGRTRLAEERLPAGKAESQPISPKNCVRDGEERN